MMVTPLPVASVLEDSFAFCEGGSVQLQASGGTTYSWSPSFGLSSVTSSSPIASPKDSTLYRVIVSNGRCADSAYVLIQVHEKPKAYAGSDLVIVEGQGAVLNAAIAGSPYSFSWTPDYRISDVHALKPFVTPQKDTSYMLNVVSLLGCESHSDTVRIRVLKNIAVPNVFTPNGDGINDLWTIAGLETYPGHDVKVFNTYGQIVFQSRNFTSWNGNYLGRPLPVGTYYYIIEVPERGRFSGYVDILR
jgi:gliding motility-associated-like protein